MAVLRFLATAGACATAALAIGQFMESGVSRASATPVELPQTFPEPPILIGSLPDSPPLAAAAFDRPVPMRAPVPLARLSVPRGEGCGLSLSAEPRPGAMAALQLKAPCAPMARVMLRHQGLTVTLLTDGDGRAEALFPALSAQAVFMAEAGGKTAIASVDLPDMQEWQRVALQWRDSDGISLHALAPGGRPGGAGDLSLDAPADSTTDSGTGAVMVALGHAAAPEAHLAQIYSAPVGETRGLRVEIEVTAENCGTPMQAEMMRSDGKGGLASLDLEVTLPGCDALGELLVLQHLEPGLTLASR